MRLHLPGEPSNGTWRAHQAGLHLIAQGTFTRIGTIAARGDEDRPKHVAREHRGVLSLTAWRADEADVVRLGA